MAQSSAHFHTLCTWHDSMTWDSPQSVPSPWPLDSGEVSISSVLDRKSKPFNASSVSGSSLVSILAGDNDDEGFFLRIWVKKPKYSMYILYVDARFQFVWLFSHRPGFHIGPVPPLTILFLILITELSCCVLNELEDLQYSTGFRDLGFPVDQQTPFHTKLLCYKDKTAAGSTDLMSWLDNSVCGPHIWILLPVRISRKLQFHSYTLLPLPFADKSVPFTRGSVLARSPVLPPPSPVSPSRARTLWDFTSRIVSV